MHGGGCVVSRLPNAKSVLSQLNDFRDMAVTFFFNLRFVVNATMYIALNTYDFTMLIIFYGEYTLSVGKMGDSYKDSV